MKLMLALFVPPVSLLVNGRITLGLITILLWPMGIVGTVLGAGIPIALAYSVPGPLARAFTVDPAFIPMLAIGIVLIIWSTVAAVIPIVRATTR